jgi:predicted Zn-dependent protease with MMP-like domain
MSPAHDDPDLQLIEAIYDALDASEPARALQLVQATLGREELDDPVLHFLAGVALRELDRPDQAARELGRAVELDPDDAEFRANLAFALFSACRFSDAEQAARQAILTDARLPDAHYALALVLERCESSQAAAEDAFRRAAELDPEAYPAPRRSSREAFESLVRSASDQLPERFQRPLSEVVVSVENLPSDEILRSESIPLDPELFGLFVGVPLTARTTFAPGGELPPRVLIFQCTLERCFPVEAQLVEEIARTLYHELGHYLGMDEDDLEAIGLD